MTIPQTVRNLDEALARNVALEVEAANWRVKALQFADEVSVLESRLKFAEDTSRELVRMVDSLRSERDEWRARASQ
jgi:hypothetical protein